LLNRHLYSAPLLALTDWKVRNHAVERCTSHLTDLKEMACLVKRWISHLANLKVRIYAEWRW
jgi:hypothetical protein